MDWRQIKNFTKLRNSWRRRWQRFVLQNSNQTRALGQWLWLIWSFPTPEVRGSNPVIGKKSIERLLSTVLKDKNKEKIGREWPIFKKTKALNSIKYVDLNCVLAKQKMRVCSEDFVTKFWYIL